MFEFHGWATLRDSAAALDDDPLVTDAMVDQVRALLGEVAEAAGFTGGLAEVRMVNGDWHVVLHGLRNHRQDWWVDVYARIAAAAPGAYGLLHVHDDEAEDDSRWVCWTMLRGRIEESTEERLTPHVGRVEDFPSYEQ
jgi:immunity protein 7 of polymorphic toxin system